MATTSLWAIRGRIDHAIEYIENEEKTLEQVIDYATNEYKTGDKRFVTCINCNMFDPQKSMIQTKKLFHDESQITAFHGYQSFEKGEVSAEKAHEIGVRLAQELYGDRFEIIVSTHLDRDHMHNHFFFNSSSFVNGKRFCNTKKDYRELRNKSDELCKEYGLSVIQNPEKGSQKVNYHRVKSYIKDIQHEIDVLVDYSATLRTLLDYMAIKGYHHERIDGEDYIYHPYYQEPIPVKSLGENYHFDHIRERLSDCYVVIQEVAHLSSYVKLKDYYKQYKSKKLTEIAGLYIAYFISKDVLPSPKQRLSKETKQPLHKLDLFTKEVDLLCHYQIENIDQLDTFQQQMQEKLDELIKERQKCYKGRMKAKSVEEKYRWSHLAKQFTPDIKKYRELIKASERIRSRSFDPELEKQARKKIKNIKAR